MTLPMYLFFSFILVGSNLIWLTSGSDRNTCPIIENIKPCKCSKYSYSGTGNLECSKGSSEEALRALNIIKAYDFSLQRFKLHGVKHTILEDYTFIGANLRTIDISFCNLTILQEHSLTSTRKNLKNLYLNHNNITEFPGKALRHLSELLTLEITHNFIEYIPNNAFFGLSKLYQLSLSQNKIKVIAPDTFDSLRGLNILELNDNNITNLPADLFNELKKITVLEIARNNISEIATGSFAGLSKVHRLTMAGNKLKVIEDDSFSSDLKKVSFLYLENNRISYISEHAFQSFEDELVQVLLNNNALKGIPKLKAKNKFSRLKYLYLNSNKIKYINETLDYAPVLRQLILRNNSIEEICSECFTGLDNLAELDLRNNSLDVLPENTVKPIFNTIQEILLQGNPLRCSCEINWLYRWIKDEKVPNSTEEQQSWSYRNMKDHKCIKENNDKILLQELSEEQFKC